MAVNSNEFRAIRGFVEPPQNMHADSLGLFKLVNQKPNDLSFVVSHAYRGVPHVCVLAGKQWLKATFIYGILLRVSHQSSFLD